MHYKIPVELHASLIEFIKGVSSPIASIQSNHGANLLNLLNNKNVCIMIEEIKQKEEQSHA